ncbi:hypothetical protein L873DRAFT_1776984 [Choiromyces venosus 120613-1]|uniref:Uncharacterized protein n=1 Tax=Choiromyces venosus 120613-1 TaxID=1336337 RepID=A0A3N4JJ53_9PEZI|nr:hypothetical protein L873DRAFT_1776984 [Choiromyces venosus 120613-1]
MQAKIFLSSLLATLLATGVIASPAAVGARDVKSEHGWDGTVTPLEKVATVGAKKAPPKGAIITPKDSDVPVVTTSVEARDIEALSKRTPGCIFVTTDSNWGGTSAYICLATNGGCTIWNNFWRWNISSFGPDPGTTCQISTGTNCDGTTSVAFGYPGYGNLGVWNDNMGSFRCWW